MTESHDIGAGYREKRHAQKAAARRLLRQAQEAIPIAHHVPAEGERVPDIRGELTGTLDEFEMFLFHGEYEVARAIASK